MLAPLTLSLLLSSIQLSQAINVYLNPQRTFLRSTLSPEDATSELSRHLGLESFVPFRDASPEEYAKEFVARGQNNALLLTMSEEDAEGVCDTVRQIFQLTHYI